MRLVWLLLVCGCEAVPDVTYSDAGDTCPSQVPSFATVCCGAIPCSGANCAAACTACQKCSPIDLCCPNTGGQVVCKPSLACQ
jgi:hypothetical protein